MLKDDIAQEFLRILRKLRDAAKQEIRDQGHVASGKGVASVEERILSQDADSIKGAILALDYMVGPVEHGVRPDRVAYTPNSGRPPSKYISGLIRWSRYVKPSLNDKDRMSFVFAVANTHLREGIPSRGSYSFSNNGRRRHWIENGAKAVEEDVSFDLQMLKLLSSTYEKILSPSN